MTRRTVLVSVIFSLFAILLVTAAATAEPIRVNAGELLVVERSGTLQISGEQGFSLSARVDAAFGVFSPWSQCSSTPECSPGDSVSLRAFWSGFDVRNGVLTFEGETYQVREFGSGASVAVQFAGSFIAPPLAESAVVTAPFTLVPFTPTFGGSGFILPYPSLGIQPFFGFGTATINLSPWGSAFPGVWTVDSVRYEFSATEPVPEPGTMLLVGLGIAGAARRLRRARI